MLSSHRRWAHPLQCWGEPPRHEGKASSGNSHPCIPNVRLHADTERTAAQTALHRPRPSSRRYGSPSCAASCTPAGPDSPSCPLPSVHLLCSGPLGSWVPGLLGGGVLETRPLAPPPAHTWMCDCHVLALTPLWPPLPMGDSAGGQPPFLSLGGAPSTAVQGSPAGGNLRRPERPRPDDTTSGEATLLPCPHFGARSPQHATCPGPCLRSRQTPRYLETFQGSCRRRATGVTKGENAVCRRGVGAHVPVLGGGSLPRSFTGRCAASLGAAVPRDRLLCPVGTETPAGAE